MPTSSIITASKNGILPVVLPLDAVDKLMETAQAGQKITIDLTQQTVTAGNHAFSFDIDPFRKHCLMNGLDDIGLTMEKLESINSFEKKQKKSSSPWLYPETRQPLRLTARLGCRAKPALDAAVYRYSLRRQGRWCP